MSNWFNVENNFKMKWLFLSPVGYLCGRVAVFPTSGGECVSNYFLWGIVRPVWYYDENIQNIEGFRDSRSLQQD